MLPAERVVMETLVPNFRRHRLGHEIGVVLGAVADEVSEPQMPALKHARDVTSSTIANTSRQNARCGSLLSPEILGKILMRRIWVGNVTDQQHVLCLYSGISL